MIAAVLLIGLIILAILVVVLWAKASRLHRLYARLTKGTSGGNLEEILTNHISTVEQVSKDLSALTGRTDKLAETQQRCLQRSGVVRFDAFEDVGGEQSFALVLLDARDTGIALSSVHSRSDVRVYAKSIQEGRPSIALSAEEQKALGLAGKG
jgi:hypothetical protein